MFCPLLRPAASLRLGGELGGQQPSCCFLRLKGSQVVRVRAGVGEDVSQQFIQATATVVVSLLVFAFKSWGSRQTVHSPSLEGIE